MGSRANFVSRKAASLPAGGGAVLISAIKPEEGTHGEASKEAKEGDKPEASQAAGAQMTPSRLMLLDDMIADLDAAHDLILEYTINMAEDYDQRADDALDAVTAAANYLFSLRSEG
jgi:hypothetical protein